MRAPISALFHDPGCWPSLRPVMGAQNRRCVARLGLHVATIALGWLVASAGLAEPPVARRPTAARAMPALSLASPDPTDDADARGGIVEQDVELQRLLHRAHEAIAEERFELSVTLLRKALDESPDRLVASETQTINLFDGTPLEFERYLPVHHVVQQTIALLPAAGKREYELQADGEARGLLAASAAVDDAARELALARIDRQYRCSAVGEEAVFELACRLLDRRQFVAASRLLNGGLSAAATPSRRAEWLVRLATANAWLGDAQAARAALDELRAVAGDGRYSPIVEQIEARLRPGAISGEPSATAAQSARTAWLMPWGGADRAAVMPPLPAGFLNVSLEPLWQCAMDLPIDDTDDDMRANGGSPTPANRRKPVNGLAALVQTWRRNDWQPAAQLLFEPGRVYVHALTAAQCLDKATGRQLFRTHEHEIPYDAGEELALANLHKAMPGTVRRPFVLAEVCAFGNRLDSSIAIINGTLYVLETPKAAGIDPRVPDAINQAAATGRRVNELVAYGAHGDRPESNKKGGGKFRWKRGGDLVRPVNAVANSNDVDSAQTSPTDEVLAAAKSSNQPAPAASVDIENEVRFVSAPVPTSTGVVCAVRDGVSLWLYAVSPRSEGRVVWKSYLCDEPRGSRAPFSPVGLSVEGGDIYVATGCGLVFCLDETSGVTRWAVRYPRTRAALPAQIRRRFNIQIADINLGNQGWTDDLVVPRGRVLVTMPSDGPQLLGLDRRTGELLWSAPKDTNEGAVNYYLGVVGDALYAAGRDCVRCYQVTGGRILWELKLDQPSHARGCLTPEQIYLPLADEIVEINLARRAIARRTTAKSATNIPLGNLYSDGERLYSAGPNQVIAWTPAMKQVAAPQAVPDRTNTADTARSSRPTREGVGLEAPR